MITKIAQQYFNGADCFTRKNVKGFNKALFEVNIPDDCTLKDIYVLKSSNNSTPTEYVDNIYENGYRVDTPRRITPSIGNHKYVIDVAGFTDVRIYLEYNNTEPRVEITNASLSLLQESVEENVIAKRLVFGSNITCSVRDYNSATIKVVVPENTSSYISVIGTKDGSSPIPGSNSVGCYYKGIKFYNSIPLLSGEYDFYVDLKEFTNIAIATPNAETHILLSELPVITELYKPIFINHANSSIIDTTLFNSLNVKILSNNSGTYSIKDGNNNYLPCYGYGVKLTQTFTLDAGENIIKVDCRNADRVILYNSLNLSIEPSLDIIDDSILDENIMCDAIPYFIFGSGKQLDFIVETPNTNRGISLQGSNDGFETIDSITVLDKNTNKILNGFTANGSTYHIYANIEGYKEVRLSSSFSNVKDKIVIKDFQLSTNYVEGRTIGYPNPGLRKLLNGYRYLKFNFKKEGYLNGSPATTLVKDCSLRLRIRDENNIEIVPIYYDRSMKKADNITDFSPFAGYWPLMGTPSGGGFVIDLGTTLSGTNTIEWTYVASSETLPGFEYRVVCDIQCYVNKPEAETCLTEIIEKNDYRICQLPSESVNRDVLNSDVLEWTDNNLTFWHGGYTGVKYEIPFTADNVAHFVEGETIKFAYLLPCAGYSKTKRDKDIGRIYAASRIVVFTKSRVFHNFPVRVGMNAPASDLFMFDESTIYNRFKWLPVNDKSKVDNFHKYFPVLAEYDYDQFEGRIGTTGDADPYGNGGLPANTALQDILVSSANFWSRLTYSNMTKCQMYCAFGNYNGSPGEEALVMVTTNGGKDWHVHAYFAATDFYNYMRGGKIDITPITDVAGAYVANSLRMCRKRFNIPTNNVKEPPTPFIIESSDKTLVTGFSVDSDGDCLVTVADNVDYDGVYPIVYFENVNANSEWDYICNGSVTELNSGNNRFFRVKKVSANTYKLYGDLGNPNATDLVCRHIHAVNATQAGILISTGESYGVNPSNFFEGGFLYMMQHINNNGSQVSSASGTYPWRIITRLTSSPEGVIRASGAYLFTDNEDPTILYVSDEAFVVGDNHKRYADLPEGRTGTLPLTPGGIYVGKLSDIDNQKKFKCVCDVYGTVVGLVQNHGHFAADGHEKSICLSRDGFNWNIEMDDNSQVNGFDNYGNIYFGNKVVVFK